MTFTKLRPLGRSGIKASAIGLGCWAIGGPFTLDGRPDGWGDIDDAQSTRAIELALERGYSPAQRCRAEPRRLGRGAEATQPRHVEKQP